LSAAERTYIIELDYGNRLQEREFIRAVLHRYDKDTLIGCILLVNNDPYNLQSFICLNFEQKHEDFENWIAKHHQTKRRNFKFLFGELTDAIHRKGFNVATFCDDRLLDIVMSGERNEIFFFPDRDRVRSTFAPPEVDSTFTVFLSHSSRDKGLVDSAFAHLHGAGIRAWYDRFEIAPGDSITDRINAGLDSSSIGLLFMSESFLDQRSGWPINEANFFFQRRMRDPSKKFIIVNIGLSTDQLPAMLRDYRYIDMLAPDATQEIVDAVSRARQGP